MFDLILACTKTFGIGKNGVMPWHMPEELKIFREKTSDSVLIVGRKTYTVLPYLLGREIAVVSRSSKEGGSAPHISNSLENALEYCIKSFPKKRIFIAGGEELYNYCLKNRPEEIDRIHVSFLDEHYECDRFIDLDMWKWVIESGEKHDNFTHLVLKYSPNGEVQYLNLLEEIQNTGILKKGRNGYTKSLFGKHLKFDVSERFPLLTTKKMFFRGVVEELLFFIRGETDSKKLEEKGINIWKGNTERGFLDAIGMKERKEGIMGPLYGYQWRNFNAEYDEQTGTPSPATPAFSGGGGSIDQLANVINLIKNQPESRRILLTDFNPLQAEQGVLYPCHSIIIQFYVDETSNRLDMFCYNRSQDVFLGTPFNIASSALFLVLIAKITGLKPGFLHMSLGDTHIYSQHEEPVSLQLSRQPYVFPVLNITKEIKNLEDVEKLTFQDFKLEEYQSHQSIKAEMVA